MIHLLIALIIIGFIACMIWWLIVNFAPAEIQFPLKAGLAAVVVIGLLVLIGRSGLLAGL